MRDLIVSYLNVIHGRAANTTKVRIFAANHPIIEVFQPPVSLIRLSTSWIDSYLLGQLLLVCPIVQHPLQVGGARWRDIGIGSSTCSSTCLLTCWIQSRPSYTDIKRLFPRLIHFLAFFFIFHSFSACRTLISYYRRRFVFIAICVAFLRYWICDIRLLESVLFFWRLFCRLQTFLSS